MRDGLKQRIGIFRGRSVWAVGLAFFLAVHLAAGLVPFADYASTSSITAAEFSGWPQTYQGHTLTPLRADVIEARFADRFPGRLARFTDGSRELVWRYLERPTRQLHAAADCYQGAGYLVQPQPVQRDPSGYLMGCILATRDERVIRVCERVFDADGNNWYDVSSWFWAALLEQSSGPWWAVTIAEEI